MRFKITAFQYSFCVVENILEFIIQHILLFKRDFFEQTVATTTFLENLFSKIPIRKISFLNDGFIFVKKSHKLSTKHKKR